jgi:hypothetical protein
MGDIKGYVLQYKNEPKHFAAYLYGFGVNRSELKDQHKQWLRAALVTPARASHFPGSSKRVDVWHIWLMGTASRTGKWKANMDLSQRRAKAVAAFVDAELGKVPHRIHTNWSGETIAALKGQPNAYEDPLDRAAMISIQRLAVPVFHLPAPPSPVPRPSGVSVPCCYWKQVHDFLQAALDAWLYTLREAPRDKGDARYAQPDRTMFVAGLTTKGWSYERAFELYEKDHHVNVYLERAYDSLNTLPVEIREWDKVKDKCSRDDPDGLCKTGYYRYK